MPKVSVIMPVYKTEATVGAAIASVCAQTEEDFELICVNDGSPDRAADVIASYAARDPRIRVFTQTNRGLSAARNKGLDEARGEYVAFLDSDDVLPFHALATLLRAAVETGAPVVVSTHPEDVETEEAKCRALASETPLGWTARVSHTPLKTVLAGRRMRSSAWNKLYRRETIGDLRFIEGICFEDWPFVTMLCARLDALAVVDVPCYVYAKIGASIVRSAFTADKVSSYVRGIRAVAAFVAGLPTAALARWRCARAADMMVSKASRVRDRTVRRQVRVACAALRSDGIVSLRDLSLKTRWRLLWM